MELAGLERADEHQLDDGAVPEPALAVPLALRRLQNQPGRLGRQRLGQALRLLLDGGDAPRRVVGDPLGLEPSVEPLHGREHRERRVHGVVPRDLRREGGDVPLAGALEVEPAGPEVPRVGAHLALVVHPGAVFDALAGEAEPPDELRVDRPRVDLPLARPVSDCAHAVGHLAAHQALLGEPADERPRRHHVGAGRVLGEARREVGPHVLVDDLGSDAPGADARALEVAGEAPRGDEVVPRRGLAQPVRRPEAQDEALEARLRRHRAPPSRARPAPRVASEPARTGTRREGRS